VTNFSLRFSILSPSSVIDQSFVFLNKLNSITSIKVLDDDNKLKELDLSAEQFKLNKNIVRKRQIIINNKTGLVIEGGAVTTEYIYSNNLMEKIWGQNTTRTSPIINRMNKPQENHTLINLIQFLIIAIIIFIMLADKIPVIIDTINKNDNVRLVDGWGDGIKDVFYFLTVAVVWLTMKFRKNKTDFIVTLLFGLSIMLCVSSIGFYKFLSEAIICITMFCFITCSTINKARKQKNNSK
jgi:hypothetical protein